MKFLWRAEAWRCSTAPVKIKAKFLTRTWAGTGAGIDNVYLVLDPINMWTSMKLLLGVVARTCMIRAFLSYTVPSANEDSQVFLQFIKQFVSSVFPEANIFARTFTNH